MLSWMPRPLGPLAPVARTFLICSAGVQKNEEAPRVTAPATPVSCHPHLETGALSKLAEETHSLNHSTSCCLSGAVCWTC